MKIEQSFLLLSRTEGFDESFFLKLQSMAETRMRKIKYPKTHVAGGNETKMAENGGKAEDCLLVFKISNDTLEPHENHSTN